MLILPFFHLLKEKLLRFVVVASGSFEVLLTNLISGIFLSGKVPLVPAALENV
jgi:hypothetical protein